MAYDWSESAWDNFGKFLYQLQPKTKTFVTKLENILMKLYRQNVSLLFNQTCLAVTKVIDTLTQENFHEAL